GLPEAINEGQYLVPQLTRNELKEVIENPVSLAGKKISPELVELLVNEIEDSKLKENLDQLPILQHALMRTYNEALKEGPDVEIGYEHYLKTGGMEKALANHAEEKFELIGDVDRSEKIYSKKQTIAKIIFKTLTDLGADQKGGRRPTELKNIYAIAASLNVSEREVDEVVNHFRGSDTSFIMPPINTDLYPNLIIDISHESLMRNWTRLTEWISEEAKFGNLYQQLNERRELHEHDKEEWLRGMLLRELLSWKNSYANNTTWAIRYHQLASSKNDSVFHEKLYQQNLNFLNESNLVSEKIKNAEKEELVLNLKREQREQSNKKRNRIFAVAAVISLLFGFWAFAASVDAKRQKLLAEENEKKASEQKLLADSSAVEAKKNAESANTQRLEAVKQQQIAEQQTALAERRGELLAQYAELAKKQKDSALILKVNA
ncbi:MAG TPA: hypothetical protein VIY47_04910, partial [Ignavibacteriaceae bacterium]